MTYAGNALVSSTPFRKEVLNEPDEQNDRRMILMRLYSRPMRVSVQRRLLIKAHRVWRRWSCRRGRLGSAVFLAAADSRQREAESDKQSGRDVPSKLHLFPLLIL